MWLSITLFACRQVMVSPVPSPPQDPTRAYGHWLSTVVSEDGYLDYERAAANRQPLDLYVAWIGRRNLFAEKNSDKVRGKQAFHLNAYNALVIFQILERGTPDSVLDVKGGWMPGEGSTFFYNTAFQIAKDKVSLGDIKNERLRWMDMDYRDHAGLNDGAMSSPPLRRTLFHAKKVKRELDEQMYRWIMDDERGVRIENEKAVFNPIFDWYARDFEFLTIELTLCQMAARHATGDKKRRLQELQSRGCPHSFFEFDWRLNDTSNH